MKRDLKNRVISHKNLPTKIPLIPTLVIWLVLERLHAPQWLDVVVATLGVLLWIGCFVGMSKQIETDIFPKDL